MKNKKQKIEWLNQLLERIDTTQEGPYLCNILCRIIYGDMDSGNIEKHFPEFYKELYEMNEKNKKRFKVNTDDSGAVSYCVWKYNKIILRKEFVKYLINKFKRCKTK